MLGKRHTVLKVRTNNGSVILSVRGNLDGSSACEVEQALEHLHRISKYARLIVDLSAVRNFEYFGIAILTKVIRDQRKHFQHMLVTGLQASTESLFRRFGLESGTANKGVGALRRREPHYGNYPGGR